MDSIDSVIYSSTSLSPSMDSLLNLQRFPCVHFFAEYKQSQSHHLTTMTLTGNLPKDPDMSLPD